ncbi:unnamed protein product [Calypogeia fissa]
MLTNIFRIGGLHQVSWFQLVPDAERVPPTTIRKDAGSQDVASIAVVMAHVRLQEEGHLSCWTVPAQKEGALTRTVAADGKINLWIFAPGVQETISPSLQPHIAGLKVVGAGLWCSPGDDEEVTAAFCEALRNRIERSLKGLSYVRFGDVFVKCRRQATFESRKVLPTCELMFMGSEDAVFVHVMVRRKRVRLLAASDLQSALAQHKNATHRNLPVIVAPYGSSGCLTGCCPGDLVTQLQRSKLQAFNSSSLPFRAVGSTTNGARAVQSCYAEVWVGQVQDGAKQIAPIGSSAGNNVGSVGNVDSALDQARDGEDEGQIKAADGEALDGKVLIYPLEAVLVPVLPPIPARTYLRRCWLQEWAGTHWLEDSPITGLNWYTKDFGPNRNKLRNSVAGPNSTGLEKGNGSSSSSSSGSGGSSIKSSSSRGSGSSTSGSSGSSESEVGTAEGELEADADSLTSKATGLQPAGANIHKSAQNVDAIANNSGSKRNRGKGTGLPEEPPSKMVKMSMSPSGDMSALLGGVGNSGSKRGGGSVGELNIQGSVGIGAGTPRGAGSQAGTPWDWAEDGMGLALGGMGMDMQTDADILADFGDFGNFFEDDGLDFGEPPGTAESQLIFDFVDGVNTPGTMSMDGPDPMLLPIIDFPTLEGFGKQLGPNVNELSAKGIKNETLQVQSSGQFSPLTTTPGVAVDPLAKAEALMLFAPGYARVELPSVKDEVAFSCTYVPESRNAAQQQSLKDAYVYSATPPPSTSVEILHSTLEQIADQHSRDDISDSKIAAEAGGDLKSFSRQASNVHVTGKDSIDGDSMATSKMRGAPYMELHEVGLDTNGPSLLESQTSSLVQDYSGESPFPTLDPRIFPSYKSASPVLATELDCALVQVSMLCAKDGLSPSSTNHPVGASPSSGGIKSLVGAVKEELSQVQVDQLGRVSSKPPQALKKKSLPSRIAGDADEDVPDGLRGAQVGVWRPVQAPKPQKVAHSTVESRIGSSSASPDTGNPGLEGGMTTGGLKPNNWQTLIDAIPLLAQQAAVSSDIGLDGECGDGPLGWLAFQEWQTLRSSCGPSMSHTGCGGMFSIRHCLDNAGMEYIDPFAAEVSPATVAHLLQSDFRIAITAAFGETNADGPLTSPDWCRSRAQGDASSSMGTDSKEGTSSITSAGGETVTPLQGLSSNLVGLKGTAGLEDLDQRRGSTGRNMENSSLSDQTRGDEAGTSDSDLQANSNSFGATIVALPTPALLVGYQDDWLKTSPSVLHMWEKAPLEPYAHPKPVSYYVLCHGLDSLLSAANDFFQQLGSVYEACRLGTHVPGTTAGLNSGSSKQLAPGILIVDAPPDPVHLGSALGMTGDFMASMGSGWNFDDYRKALLRVCRAVPLSANQGNMQRDPEQSPSTVVYVVSPSSEPTDVLQIILDVSQCLGISVSDKDRKATSFNQSVGAVGEDSAISPVVGFSTPRLVLQVLPAEVVMKGSGTVVASQLDTLKEVAFGVYSKARRIQRKIVIPESTPTIMSSSRGRSGIVQAGPTMPGMWKDCNTGRNSGASSVLDSGSLRSPWDGGWQSASRFGDSSLADGSSLGVDPQSAFEASRFLYEPLFILADPGYPDPNANNLPSRAGGKEALRSTSDDVTGSTSGLTAVHPETGANTGSEGPDGETAGAGHLNPADLHCCYAWTDDWQWLVSVWTDARGELLDIFVLPLLGTQREQGFLNHFSQVLQQGLQLLSMAVEAGSRHLRNIVISRLGGFTEKECQEWYRTVMTMGGDESRKWPLQLWPGAATGNSSMQSQDMGLHSDRTLGLATSSSRPPSPNPASSFSSRSKPLGMPMNLPRRQGQGLGASQLPMESKGPFQWVNSISLVSVRVEHSLQAVSVCDTNASSGLSQGGTSATGPANSIGNASSTTGVSMAKTLAHMGASFMLVPTNSLRTLSPQAWQLPTVTSQSASPLAQLLEGSPLAPPLASAFVVSPPVPSPMSDFVQQTTKEEWPSTLHVGLIALSGNSSSLDSSPTTSKSPKDFSKDAFMEAHRAVQSVAAQVHALSWLTVSPTFLLRHSPLPFHCNVAQRLRRLLSYLDTVHAFPRLPHTPL